MYGYRMDWNLQPNSVAVNQTLPPPLVTPPRGRQNPYLQSAVHHQIPTLTCAENNVLRP